MPGLEGAAPRLGSNLRATLGENTLSTVERGGIALPKGKDRAGTSQRPSVHWAEWRNSTTRSEQSGILQGFESQLSAQVAQGTVQQGKPAPQAIP